MLSVLWHEYHGAGGQAHIPEASYQNQVVSDGSSFPDSFSNSMKYQASAYEQ